MTTVTLLVTLMLGSTHGEMRCLPAKGQVAQCALNTGKASAVWLECTTLTTGAKVCQNRGAL